MLGRMVFRLEIQIWKIPSCERALTAIIMGGHINENEPKTSTFTCKAKGENMKKT